MKSIISGFLVAFSLYSTIPVPQVHWEKKTMRWALSFLPIIGLVIGGFEWVWLLFCKHFDASILLYSIVAALLPVAVSGGIHLDGLTDTCDALCSYGERARKLEILKDPHVGAFGVMWQTVFLLLEAALFAQIYQTPALLPVMVFGFAIARAVGGRKVVSMPCAKDSGLAYLFAEGSDKKAVAVTTLVEALVFAAVIGRWMAAQIWVVPVYVLLFVVWERVHHRLSMQIFGGITGDLAGFFISIGELLSLAVCAFGGLLL